jgi:hypothetical protein
MPDTVNGLNCLPFSPAALVAKPEARPPVEKVPLSEEARVERAFDGRYLGNEYQLYLSEAAGQISFAQYMWEDTQRRRKGFAGCAFIGGLFVAGGLALYVSAFMKLTEDGDDLFVPLLMSAIGCAALGGVLLGVGAHGARHEKRNREKLDGLLFEERNGRPLARSWALSPFAIAGGAGVMAAIEL